MTPSQLLLWNCLLVAQLGIGQICLSDCVFAIRLKILILKEQCADLKLVMKLGNTAIEAHTLLKQVNSDKFLSNTKVFEWFR